MWPVQKTSCLLSVEKWQCGLRDIQEVSDGRLFSAMTAFNEGAGKIVRDVVVCIRKNT